MRLLLCLLLVPLLAVAAGAQWKWRDANGQVQYSDRPPPPGVPDKDILQRPVVKTKPIQIISTDAPASAPPAEPKPAPAASAPKVSPEKKKAEEEQKAKQAAAEAENRRRRAENCEQARARLAEIDSGQRLGSIDAKGERVVWDDARRAAERQRVQAIANESCR